MRENLSPASIFCCRSSANRAVSPSTAIKSFPNSELGRCRLIGPGLGGNAGRETQHVGSPVEKTEYASLTAIPYRRGKRWLSSTLRPESRSRPDLPFDPNPPRARLLAPSPRGCGRFRRLANPGRPTPRSGRRGACTCRWPRRPLALPSDRPSYPRATARSERSRRRPSGRHRSLVPMGNFLPAHEAVGIPQDPAPGRRMPVRRDEGETVPAGATSSANTPRSRTAWSLRDSSWWQGRACGADYDGFRRPCASRRARAVGLRSPTFLLKNPSCGPFSRR